MAAITSLTELASKERSRKIPIMNNETFEVSVVMPCLNEAETIEICITKALSTFEKHGVNGEVVIGDNGSTDGSQEIATAAGARVVDVDRRGYGAALMGGIEAVNSDYVIMGDADDSYDFNELFVFVEKLRQNIDFVMGCRFPSGGGTIMAGAMPFLHRWLGTPVLTFLCRLLFNAPIHDVNCGMRGFTLDAYRRLDLQTTGMEFASEMIIKAALKDLRIAEVPITLSPDGRTRPAHLRTWRDGWRHLRFMLLFSPGWVLVFPGLILFALSLMIFSVLMFGPVRINNMVFAQNTLMVCALGVLVGFQFTLVGFFTKLFAAREGLIPASPTIVRIMKFFNLELGLGIGLVLMLTGLGYLGHSLLFWQSAGFGNLDAMEIGFKTTPAVTAIMLGLQTVSASFFLGVLGLARKGDRINVPLDE